MNPRWLLGHTGFQDRHHKPLGHLSIQAFKHLNIAVERPFVNIPIAERWPWSLELGGRRDLLLLVLYARELDQGYLCPDPVFPIRILQVIIIRNIGIGLR